jgi:hypothetical protein
MSEIKVNKISPRSGTTVTLGDSGDTFTIPSGATINNQGTATNFGATGAASWNTTVKTGDFTAVAGEGYFVNTTSGAINVTLPAGTAGAVVAIKDYAKTFDTNAVTLTRNGSDKIGGQAINAILSTEGIAVTLVFIDSTQGWLVTDDGVQSSASTAAYVTATGGTITTTPCGNFKIHTFTGPGTFCVSAAGNPCGSSTVDYLIAGGGGGGGYCIGGGGGAGGIRVTAGTASGSYCAGPGPLAGPVSPVPVSVQGYPIVVGSGGAAPTGSSRPQDATAGGVSSFNSITAAGGGRAGTYGVSGGPGGSGGGAGGWTTQPGPACGGTAAGSGNVPSVSPPQGNNGGANTVGSTPAAGGAGGGGATAVGADSTSSPPGGQTSAGGAGLASSITGSGVTYSTGGDGKGDTAPGAAAGGANTGDGGDGEGGGSPGAGKTGGSGIVIIRYKFQN